MSISIKLKKYRLKIWKANACCFMYSKKIENYSETTISTRRRIGDLFNHKRQRPVVHNNKSHLENFDLAQHLIGIGALDLFSLNQAAFSSGPQGDFIVIPFISVF